MKKPILLSILVFFAISLKSQSDTSFTFNQALPSDYVKETIEVESINEIWVATYTGIGRYDGNTWTQETYLGGNAQNPNVYEIIEASDGKVWAALGSSGVSAYDGNNWVNFTVADGLASNSNWSIGEDSSGNIWAGSTDAGVSVFDGNNWVTYNESDGLAGKSVVEILTTYRGNVWLGTANGASVYDGSDFRTFTTSEGLPSNLVRSLYQDNDGNIVVGTSSGVGFYNGHNWTYLTKSNGLPTNNILDVTQMHNSDFIFTSDTGAIRYYGNNYNMINYDHGLTQSVVNTAMVDSEGKIWLATPFRGLSVTDTENSFYNVCTNHDLVSDEVKALESYGKELWIGTEAGANMFDGEIWRTFKKSYGLVGDTVTDISKTGDTVVFATRSGISVFNNENYINYDEISGLVSNNVSCTEIISGDVYAGTPKGLMVVNPSSMDTLTVSDGLAGDTINDIHCDSIGNLWIATNNGLSFYDGNSFINYSSAQTGGTVIQSLEIDETGTLYAGTDSGIAVYSGTWSNYSHNHPGKLIKDIALAADNIYVTFSGAGNVEIFSTNSNTFSSYPANHKNSIAVISDSRLWLASSSGIEGVDLVSENNNSFSVSYPGCSNKSDGSITINPNTTNPPYFYSLDNGKNWTSNYSFTSLSPGQYHLKVKNSKQQFTLDTSVILQPSDNLDAFLGLEQITCNSSSDGILQLFTKSSTYNWSDNGSGKLRTNLGENTYSVTVSDGTCTYTRSNTISNPQSLSISDSVVDISCYGDTSGYIQVSVSGGTKPYSFNWDNGADTTFISGLNPGSYNLTVSDYNNCSLNKYYTVSGPVDSLSINALLTHVDCNGACNGEISLTISGGTPPYVFNWDTGQDSSVIENLCAGNYDLTLTDANNCIKTASYQITEPPILEIVSINANNVLCNGDSTGSIDVGVNGGSGNINYTWTKTGQPGWQKNTEDISNLTAGNYHLNVVDSNSCNTDTSINITEPPPLSVSLDVTPISCNGYSDGEILAQVAGGSGTYITYHWRYGNNSNIIGIDSVITNCQPGTYHIEIKDSHYCITEDSVILTDPPAHSVNLITTDMSCHGKEDGSIEVIVDNGNATGLSYQWSNGAGNTAIANNLDKGNYMVTITDSLNCNITESAAIDEPPLAELGELPASGDKRICSGHNLVLDAGSGYSSYSWNTGEITSSISVSSSGVYDVFVVDNNNCEYGDTVEVMFVQPYNDEDLCFVTVDQNNDNKIIWEKTPNQGTYEYKIYRKDNSNYNKIGSIPYSSPAVFTDTTADAATSDESYKISVVDTCGNESSLSDMHSSIYLDVNADLNGACHLNWDAYDGYFVVYYYILRGTNPNNMQVVDSVLYNDFDYTEMNTDSNGVYYQIMVRKTNVCDPGNSNFYDKAYSNIVYCDNLVGIPENSAGGVDVYPNPFADILNIGLYLKKDSYVRVEMYNSMGQRVLKRNKKHFLSGKNILNINTGSLCPGIYHLRIFINNEVIQKDIIRY